MATVTLLFVCLAVSQSVYLPVSCLSNRHRYPVWVSVWTPLRCLCLLAAVIPNVFLSVLRLLP